MTTQREEMEKKRPGLMAIPTPQSPEQIYKMGFAHALRDYGDYEIVEGVLVDSGLCIGIMKDGFTHPHILGDIGDHIKILVPPRTGGEGR